MLYHYDRGSVGDQAPEHFQQRPHVEGMKPYGRLVKDEDAVVLSPAHLACQLEPLRLATGQGWSGFPQGKIAEPQVVQYLQPVPDKPQVGAGHQRFIHAHGHQAGQGDTLPADVERLPGIPGTVAVRTGDVHVRKELDVKADAACAIADGATERPGVVGEVTGLAAGFPGTGSPGKDFPEFIVDVGVRGDGGAYVDTYRGGIDQFHLPDPFSLDGLDMVRQPFSARQGLQGRDQAFQHQCSLAGAGHPGDDGQAPLWETDLQRADSVDARGFHPDGPIGEYVIPGLRQRILRSAEEGADPRTRVGRYPFHRALRDYPATAGTGLGSQLDDPVGVPEDFRVMVHDDY